MDAQRKIYNTLRLIARLSGSFGVTKDTLAEELEVSVRSIERYLNTLSDVGFEVETVGEKRYKIMKATDRSFKQEELLHFTYTEAEVLVNALHYYKHNENKNLKRAIEAKLVMLTSKADIAANLHYLHISQNLKNLERAIKEERQVILKDYFSTNSMTETDRKVEPLSLNLDLTYLVAYDVNKKGMRQFKVERTPKVELLNQTFQHKACHQPLNIDLFGMPGLVPQKVVLKMSHRAYKLMLEEYPKSRSNITEKEDAFIFEGEVNKFMGVGRFVLGLLGEVEVVENEDFKSYLVQKIKENQKKIFLRH